MDQEAFDTAVRKFLRQIGVTSHQAIERAVSDAIQSGRLSGDEVLKVKATITIDGLDFKHEVDGEIPLG